MRVKTILSVAGFWILAVVSVQAQERLEGCADPQAIANIFSSLQRTNSRQPTVGQIRSLWPVEMNETESTSTNRTLQSDDRILKGECQCCTTFLFYRSPQQETEHELYSVIVNYSAKRHEDLTSIATMFESAMGLGTADVAKVVTPSVEDYSWQIVVGNKVRLYKIEVSYAQKGSVWKMKFHAGFIAVDPEM